MGVQVEAVWVLLGVSTLIRMCKGDDLCRQDCGPCGRILVDGGCPAGDTERCMRWLVDRCQ